MGREPRAILRQAILDRVYSEESYRLVVLEAVYE